MLIAHLTDIHLGSGEHARPNGERLDRCVAAVAALAPDVVLVTGDIAEAGEAAAYDAAKRALAPFGERLCLTVGNHDRRDAFAGPFAAMLADGLAQRATDFGDLRIVTVDTLDEGWETAGFCADRAARLDTVLAQAPARPTLLALHHPPVRTGVEWMDVNADGPWSQRLRAVVARHPQVVALLAGHVHLPLATSFAGRPLIVAPSVAPPVAYDPRPLDPARPDGRALIVARAPGFAMHRWTGTDLISWFGIADDAPATLRFDEANRAVVATIAAEARTHAQ